MNAPNPVFATVLTCMDGRIQLPVNEAARALFSVTYVDTITEAGIVKFLADQPDSNETKAALSSVRISMDAHNSRAIAVVAHYDCKGNPCSDERQQGQLCRAIDFLKGQFRNCEITGLWVDADWNVNVVVPYEPDPGSEHATA